MSEVPTPSVPSRATGQPLDLLAGPRRRAAVWLGAPTHRRRLAVGAAVALAGAVLAWWALRPPATVPVEATLPRARAAAATASTAAGAVPGTGAVTTTAAAAALVVHVAGAVARPGLVEVAGGARVADAVAAAGGATSDADLARVNLAAKIADGQRIVVPRAGEPVPVAAAEAGGAGALSGGGGGAAAAGPIDLNTASVTELDALPGVGPATAAAIVAYREQHGPFRSVDALLEVRGIGTAKLDQLRPLVRV